MSVVQRLLSVSLLLGIWAFVGCQEAGTSPSGTSAQIDGAIESVSPYVVLTDPPKELLDRMRSLGQPSDVEGAKAADEFIQSGHPIVPYIMGELKDEKKFDEPVAKDIENRIAKRAVQKLTGQEVVTMLELAAYADVNCHSMEYPLRVATLQYIQLHKDEADVIEALSWIESSYESRLRTAGFHDTPDFVSSSLPNSMKIRMIEYADALLQAKTTDDALKEQTPARDKVKEPKVSKRVRLQ